MSVPDKFQLPDPAPLPPDHHKWKEMVDSVIDFISASRTMLDILKGRMKDHELQKEEQLKKQEDDKVRLQFYRECLHMDIPENVKTQQDAKEGTETLNVEKRPKRLVRNPKHTSCIEDKTKAKDQPLAEGTPTGRRKYHDSVYSCKKLTNNPVDSKK